MKAGKFGESVVSIARTLAGKKQVGPYFAEERQTVLRIAGQRDIVRNIRNAAHRAFLTFCMDNAMQSRSQIFQDLFVAFVLERKRGGFFCDFGATNGFDLSNSHYLEKQLGWSGICAEPARGWHKDLRRNRPGAKIETACVWTRTGDKLTFKESSERELSTLDGYVHSDRPKNARKRLIGETYEVETISLNDLLAKHGAPTGFDYLSMDTEGSELEILETFDIARFQPKIITIEHNYTVKRDEIFRRLTKAGYRRVFEPYSLFDDWYLAPGVRMPGEVS